MSSADRARHLNSFVAESYPPPLPQHLPPMPSASQRFASTMQKQQELLAQDQRQAMFQQQQLQQQQQQKAMQPNQFNFVDPFAMSTGVAARNFDPFQSLVLNPQKQSVATDSFSTTSSGSSADGDGDDSSESTFVDNVPRVVSAPTPPAIPATTATERAASTKKAKPAVAAPTTVPPATVAATQPKEPAPAPAVAAPTIATVAPTAVTVPLPAAIPTVAAAATTPNVNEEPRGIMDQTMSFIKRNFWPILTVLVVLVTIGVAFIYFANRPRADAGKGVVAAAPLINAPPGEAAHWSDPGDNLKDAKKQQNVKGQQEEELLQTINKEAVELLIKEKQKSDQAYQELQKRLSAIEKEIDAENATRLAEITKLQNMCEKLYDDRQALQDHNQQLSDIIVQSGFLDAEEQLQTTVATGAASDAVAPIDVEDVTTSSAPAPLTTVDVAVASKKRESVQPTAIAVARDTTPAPKQPTTGGAHQTDFDEPLDLASIEASASRPATPVPTRLLTQTEPQDDEVIVVRRENVKEAGGGEGGNGEQEGGEGDEEQEGGERDEGREDGKEQENGANKEEEEGNTSAPTPFPWQVK